MALGFYLRDQVLPRFQEPIREALSLQRGQKPLAPQPYHDPQNGIWIRVSEYSTTARVGQGVEVSKLYSDQKPSLQIDANRIEWVPSPGKEAAGGKWILRAGSIQRWDDQGSLVVNAGLPFFLLWRPSQNTSLVLAGMLLKYNLIAKGVLQGVL